MYVPTEIFIYFLKWWFVFAYGMGIFQHVNDSIHEVQTEREKQHFPHLGWPHTSVRACMCLTFWRHELSYSQRSSTSSLHKLHFRHNDVVFQHGTTAHADRVAAGMVDIDVWAATVLAHPGTHGTSLQASKPVRQINGKDFLKVDHHDFSSTSYYVASIWLWPSIHWKSVTWLFFPQ